jgi:hypothetical protein
MIIYIDTSAVREGKLEELRPAMGRLAAFVDANMPRLISYGFFLDRDSQKMAVTAIHPDSASLEFHLDAGGEEFRKFADLIELLKIDVYGQITEAALARLHRKARMLGNATVSVYDLQAGFARLP